MNSPPLRGEIWLAALNPTRGHEQAGRRPVLVVFDDKASLSLAALIDAKPLHSHLLTLESHDETSGKRSGRTKWKN